MLASMRCWLLVLLISCDLGLAEENLIDCFLDARLSREKIPAAEVSTDSEFIRRINLDLFGRLPEPAVARQFLDDRDPQKRTRMIESLIPPLPVSGMRSVKEAPFLDRWTYFFL